MSLLLCYEQRIPLFVTELLSGLTSVQSVLRYLRGGGAQIFGLLLVDSRHVISILPLMSAGIVCPPHLYARRALALKEAEEEEASKAGTVVEMPPGIICGVVEMDMSVCGCVCEGPCRSSFPVFSLSLSAASSSSRLSLSGRGVCAD